jgi:hypothetical protein
MLSVSAIIPAQSLCIHPGPLGFREIRAPGRHVVSHALQ